MNYCGIGMITWTTRQFTLLLRLPRKADIQIGRVARKQEGQGGYPEESHSLDTSNRYKIEIPVQIPQPRSRIRSYTSYIPSDLLNLILSSIPHQG